MSERIPAEVFPVQEYIANEMEARGWTSEALARESGLSSLTCFRLLHESVRVNGRIAMCLAQAFETTPEVWRNLDTAYWKWFDAQEVTGDE